ncbi:MAG: primosomal protein N' [Lachnospiraceae bacterium]|nr:primosomal protein N' [Lachnospiraceae bacterium]MDE6999017.1 primosomal protein N' [Lachnospiraceae bacterium]
MTGRFANVIVDISHEKVDRPFQYRIPDALRGELAVGMAVMIPFGAGNKRIKGYVMEITDRNDYDEQKLKAVDAIVEDGICAQADSIRLAWWIRENYGSTMIAALKTVLPVKRKVKQIVKKTIVCKVDAAAAVRKAEEYEAKHQRAKARLMRGLAAQPVLPQSLVTGKLNVTAQTIQALEKAGLLEVQAQDTYRSALPENLSASAQGAWQKKQLSENQAGIVDSIAADFKAGVRGTYLIHGVTGSGKTEVYMELIERIIAEGRQAVMLIPEIALTYQTLVRFYQRFGDRVSVMNSRLSAGERSDQYERAASGDIDIMIGPRSALFAPFERLGLVIMDEEHEGSYKSESMPKYHAREVAGELCRMKGASLVLGSATPSIESYYRARQGEIKMFVLKERLAGGQLPKVYVEDLRSELKSGNRSIFSRRLHALIDDRLKKGEQSMLFINRRGYAGFVSCRSCGHVMKCPHCDVSLSEHTDRHRKVSRLVCHYCGYGMPGVTSCPQCGSKYILGFRAGTQQIEELLNKEFPAARVLRMDADTTKSKDSYEQILSQFADGEADILVGTQMIVKGHDFARVTLVGILAADMSLHAGDYRAGERTFQLLTQAAGRAGRGALAGEVVIQTYQPEHYAVVHAASQDYEGFYEEEISYRDLMAYPPAAHMMAVLVLSGDAQTGAERARELVGLAKSEFGEARPVLIGPTEAFIGRISDVYRYVFYIKHRDYQVLTRIKDALEQMIHARQWNPDSVQFDFDPMNHY